MKRKPKVRHVYAADDEYIKVHRGGNSEFFFWVFLVLAGLVVISRYWYLFVGAGAIFLAIKYRAKIFN